MPWAKRLGQKLLSNGTCLAAGLDNYFTAYCLTECWGGGTSGGEERKKERLKPCSGPGHADKRERADRSFGQHAKEPEVYPESKAFGKVQQI